MKTIYLFLLFSFFIACSSDDTNIDETTNNSPALKYTINNIEFTNQSVIELKKLESYNGTFYFRLLALTKDSNQNAGWVIFEIDASQLEVGGTYNINEIRDINISYNDFNYLMLTDNGTNGQIVINSINNNKVSGSFEFQNLISNYQIEPIINVENGVFSNIEIEN